ncbi:hypothetical protein IMZ48_26035 [Candidatus Bathyarchaeota archaeon]|nr:hypothetical protein [Candidatus Bathyarchaeota archaeon]
MERADDVRDLTPSNEHKMGISRRARTADPSTSLLTAQNLTIHPPLRHALVHEIRRPAAGREDLHPTRVRLRVAVYLP